MFCLDKVRVGVTAPGGFIYWKKNLSMICEFVLKQDEKTLKIAEAGPIWTNDHILRIKKDVGVPTFKLVQTE